MLPKPSNALTNLLRSEIEEHGPIPVSRWMELALYHPELGYYRKQQRLPFGGGGDFFTAEQLDPFGAMVATLAGRLAAESAHPDLFSIFELGAGRRDLQQSLAAFRYFGHDWDSPALPASHHGLVLANEFFDAMPVRVLRKSAQAAAARRHSEKKLALPSGGKLNSDSVVREFLSSKEGWKEMAVVYREHRFRLIDAPWTTDPRLLTYAQTYGAGLPRESMLEMNVGIAPWIERISQHLRSGHLLVFDYGYLPHELPRLLNGTLMSYRQHVALADVFDSPGERDITAHVNFSEVIGEGERHGLRLKWNVTLRELALQLWSAEELERRWRAADMKWRMQWKQLVFGMGDTFRALLFEKDGQK